MIRERRELTRLRAPARHHRRHRLGRELVHRRGTRIPDAVLARAARSSGTAPRRAIRRPGAASSSGARRARRSRPASFVRTATSAPGRSSIASGTVATKDSTPTTGSTSEIERIERNAFHLMYANATRIAGTHREEERRARAGLEQPNELERREEREAPDRDMWSDAREHRPDERRDQPRRATTSSGGTNASSEREHDDVLARRSADDEELGVALQHREHRLADAERPQGGQVREPPRIRRQRDPGRAPESCGVARHRARHLRVGRDERREVVGSDGGARADVEDPPLARRERPLARRGRVGERRLDRGRHGVELVLRRRRGRARGGPRPRRELRRSRASRRSRSSAVCRHTRPAAEARTRTRARRPTSR